MIIDEQLALGTVLTKPQRLGSYCKLRGKQQRKNTVNVTISFHGVVCAHCENFKLSFVKNRPCRLPTPEPFLPAGPIDAR